MPTIDQRIHNNQSMNPKRGPNLGRITKYFNLLVGRKKALKNNNKNFEKFSIANDRREQLPKNDQATLIDPEKVN